MMMPDKIEVFKFQPLYLKFEDEIIGSIDSEYNIHLRQANLNSVVSRYFEKYDDQGQRINTLPCSEFKLFLADRVISKDRKDIHTILARMGLPEYDLIAIAKKTRAFNLQDKIWISYSEAEDYSTTFRSVFIDFFNHKQDAKGDSISSPSGQNMKSYLFRSDNRYGIAKVGLHPHSADAMNEVVAYNLGKLLNVQCCYAEMITETMVFSEYEYDFLKESLIHARHFLSGEVFSVENYERLIADYFPEDKTEILKMILFDFIINQDDRHSSNWAFIIDQDDKRRIYHLYDNGRSLFNEETEKDILEALNAPEAYSNSFGLVGTYYDVAMDIKSKYKIDSLINLNVSEEQVRKCFSVPGYPEWKIALCSQWIMWTIQALKS